MNSNHTNKPQTTLLWTYGLKTISQFLFYVFELIFSGFAVSGYICALSIFVSKDFQNFKIQTQVVKTMIAVLLLVVMSAFLSKVLTRIFKDVENILKELVSMIIFLFPLFSQSVVPEFSNLQEMGTFAGNSLKLAFVNSGIVLLIIIIRKLILKGYSWFITRKIIDKSSVETTDENLQSISKFGLLVFGKQFEDCDVRKIEQTILKEDYQSIVFIEKIVKKQSLTSYVAKETGSKNEEPKLFVTNNNALCVSEKDLAGMFP